jgi:hypothetical protein
LKKKEVGIEFFKQKTLTEDPFKRITARIRVKPKDLQNKGLTFHDIFSDEFGVEKYYCSKLFA